MTLLFLFIKKIFRVTSQAASIHLYCGVHCVLKELKQNKTGEPEN
jgi:hypothetical protein